MTNTMATLRASFSVEPSSWPELCLSPVPDLRSPETSSSYRPARFMLIPKYVRRPITFRSRLTLTNVLGYQHRSLFYKGSPLFTASVSTLDHQQNYKHIYLRSQLHSSASIAAEPRFIYTHGSIKSGAATNWKNKIADQTLVTA